MASGCTGTTHSCAIRFTGMLTRPPMIIASLTVMANSIYNGWSFEDLWLESDHPYSGL
jgi:hypothetical protein